MLLQEVNSDANLDGIAPDFVHGLEPLDDALNVGAHQRHGRRGVDVLETQAPGLAVNDGNEASAKHGDGAIGTVLILAHGDGNADVHKYVRPDEAVAPLRRVIVDRLLGERNCVVDEKWLAEGERSEASPGRNGLQNGPFENTIRCAKQGVR